MNSNSFFNYYINSNKLIRTIGFTASLTLFLFAILSIFPIISHNDSAEATPGVVEVPTISITSMSNTASVDIAPTSSIGTFATSTSENRLSFDVTTSNYTGYTLTIEAGDDSGLLTNSNTADTLSSITTATDATTFATGSTSDYNNKWGYKPNIFNSVANTNYLPSPTTTASVLNYTTSANTTADSYTIDLGARVDYTKPSGTYTNTYILTATANPVAYAIEYWDLAGISSTTLNDSGITWNNPTSGIAKEATYNKIATQAASTITSATIILAPISTTTGSALTTPTRHTYTFAGWCRNSTDHTKLGVNNTVTAIQNSSNKVTAYNNPSTMCNGVVPDYNTSTDDFIKAGDTTFKLDPTKDNTNIKLYAVWKPTTFANAGIAANANMQTMTSTICSNTTPNQFTTLKDARGSATNTYVTYTIIKLLDGKCWMADNLDLDVYAYRNNLTTSNTHVSDSTALTRFVSGGGNVNDKYASAAINSGNSAAYTDPSPVSHSTMDWNTLSSNSVPLVNRHGQCSDSSYPCAGIYRTSYTHTKEIQYLNGDTTKFYSIGVGGYKIGTFYNYCAISMGSYCWGNGTDVGSHTESANWNNNNDICPAGWRLPRGGTITYPNSNYNEFIYIYSKIGDITTAPANATNPLSSQSMLSTPISGEYQNGISHYQGTNGYFGSSTFYSTSHMYVLYPSGSGFSSNAYPRNIGISVRCIAQ